MKGIVFTGLLEMIEKTDGYEAVDQVLLSTPDIRGHYTSVGTYPHIEMVKLISTYANQKQTSVETVLTEFGKYLLESFVQGHPDFFAVAGTFELLKGINERVHKEVKKLYPDAELPEFEIHQRSATSLELIYHSERNMSHLALGLILKTIEHFKESITVEHTVSVNKPNTANFKLEKYA